MAHRWTNDLTRADATPKAMWLNRRQIMAGTAGAGLVAALGGRAAAQAALEPNTLDEIRSYNNFYEFGTGKDDPKANADAMVIEPWSITVDGLVDNPGTYSLEDLIGGLTVEERIYRFRCVEAWAMASSMSRTDLGRPTSMGMIDPGNRTELRRGKTEMVSGSSGTSSTGSFDDVLMLCGRFAGGQR